MRVYIFESGDARYGLTEDCLGNNLPASLGPWLPCELSSILIYKDHPGPPRIGRGIDEAKILMAIEANGFYLATRDELRLPPDGVAP